MRPSHVVRCLAAILIPAGAAAAQAGGAALTDDPRYGLLTPIPETGGVPPIVDRLNEATAEQLAFRARARQYARQIRIIRHEHFGSIRVPEIRQRGISLLGEFTDPAAFRVMIEELAGEKDDVRLALLDHFLEQGDEGQAALAYVAIMDEDAAIRAETMRRMTSPPAAPVLRVLEQALRSSRHEVANNAGAVAGAINALETIPLLIFAQATRDEVQQTGDLAWIAIATQHAYVANVQPVVGDGAAAFQPIMGVVTEGVVLRVMDAVVVVYRTDVHRALTTMTSRQWGQPTEPFGYDMNAWWHWYNGVYVPLINEQARQAAMEREPAGAQP